MALGLGWVEQVEKYLTLLNLDVQCRLCRSPYCNFLLASHGFNAWLSKDRGLWTPRTKNSSLTRIPRAHFQRFADGDNAHRLILSTYNLPFPSYNHNNTPSSFRRTHSSTLSTFLCTRTPSHGPQPNQQSLQPPAFTFHLSHSSYLNKARPFDVQNKPQSLVISGRSKLEARVSSKPGSASCTCGIALQPLSTN